MFRTRSHVAAVPDPSLLGDPPRVTPEAHLLTLLKLGYTLKLTGFLPLFPQTRGTAVFGLSLPSRRMSDNNVYR